MWMNLEKDHFPESCPPSSHITLTFPKTEKTQGDITMHWMDGGIQPERPDELGPSENFGGEEGNGTLFIGTKGKMYASTYSDAATLLPKSLTPKMPTPLKNGRECRTALKAIMPNGSKVVLQAMVIRN